MTPPVQPPQRSSTCIVHPRGNCPALPEMCSNIACTCCLRDPYMETVGRSERGPDRSESSERGQGT